MKKIILILMVLSLTICNVFARDYAKLQIKEMKHAQKYGTTQKYLNNSYETKSDMSAHANKNLKDPKLIKLGSYEEIDREAYENKLAKDDEIYKKIAKSFGVRTVDNYNAQAKGEDYYRIYRVAEKIIRANKLDYMNWRIGVYRDADNPNAYSTNMNYIAISTSIYDTFSKNDDALAMLIGHEMGHALLGHQQRLAPLIARINRAYKLVKIDGTAADIIKYKALTRKYLIDSKNMEYAADLEGAKLASKAGYNLSEGAELLSFLNTLPTPGDYWSDHPDADKRIQNFKENRKYFMEDEWANVGRYNIYNSEVLDVNLSSDRKSIVISAPKEKLSANQYYSPENSQDIYLRFGYKSYLNGEYQKSLNYFDDLFNLNQKNAAAYLYASYAAEALYKQNKSDKYLTKAKEYIQIAKQLEPENKYILEQEQALK